MALNEEVIFIMLCLRIAPRFVERKKRQCKFPNLKCLKSQKSMESTAFSDRQSQREDLENVQQNFYFNSTSSRNYKWTSVCIECTLCTLCTASFAKVSHIQVCRQAVSLGWCCFCRPVLSGSSCIPRILSMSSKRSKRPQPRKVAR